MSKNRILISVLKIPNFGILNDSGCLAESSNDLRMNLKNLIRLLSLKKS